MNREPPFTGPPILSLPPDEEGLRLCIDNLASWPDMPPDGEPPFRTEYDDPALTAVSRIAHTLGRACVRNYFDSEHTKILSGRLHESETDHMATIALLENAKIDTVTGLVNRGKLEDTWDRLCKAMQLDPSDRRVQENREVHLLFLDLDGLKYVNDNHGHQAGDEALRKVAGIVKDILSERDVFGRYGGDEMLGILPRRSADEVLNTAITICDTIKKASIAQGLITVSIGLCKADTNQHDLSVACKPADEALYLVKNFGKDGVRRHGDPPGLIWRV